MEVQDTARHEAGHAIAAHAVGRRVVDLRCVPTELPASDPANPYDVPFAIDGFHQAEPLLGATVDERLREGQPLTPELREWCLQDAVICVAGPIAEGILGEDGSGRDIEEWAKSARALGHPRSRGSPFYDATVAVASSIIGDLQDTLEDLVMTLLAKGVMTKSSIQQALESTPRGSHRQLLEILREA